MSIISSELLLGAAGAAGGYEIERSLRFNKDDSAYLSRTFSSTGSRTTFTISAWFKRVDLPSSQFLFVGGSGANSYLMLDNGQFRFPINGGSTGELRTNAVYRDLSAWMHVVVVGDSTNATSSDRLRMYVNGERITSFVTETQPSQNATLGDFNTAAVHYFNRLQTGNYGNIYFADCIFLDGTAATADDFGEFDDNGVWQPKAYSGSYGTNGFHLDFSDNSSDAALGTDTSGNRNDWTVNNITASSAQINNENYYRNGSGNSESAYSGGTLPFDGTALSYVDSSGAITNTAWDGARLLSSTVIRWQPPSPIPINSSIDFYGGSVINTATNYSLKIVYTDATQVTTTGTTSTNNWVKRLNDTPTGKSLSYVEADAPSYLGHIMGIRIDGQFVLNVDAADCDSLFDSPANGTQTDTGVGGEVSGNYCTLNPLSRFPVGATFYTPTNGNLEVNLVAASQSQSTFAPSSGKWYAECVMISGNVATDTRFGVQLISEATSYAGNGPDSYAYNSNGSKNNSLSGGTYGDTWDVGDIIGCALDLDNGKIWWSKNGTWQASGNPSTGANPAFTGLSGAYYFAVVNGNGATYNKVLVCNFGQRAFAYTAPSGFKALCTANMPDPTIADGSTAMDAVLYSGNGSSQSISGYGFSPDLIWIKARNIAYGHAWFDIIRGTNSYIASNTVNAESTPTGFASFDSNGFSFNAGWTLTNESGRTYVGWCWDGGSSTNTNTDGTITSSVRANPSAGFSVCTYTGSSTNFTFGHGLGVEPRMIFIRNRSSSTNWFVLTKATGSWHYAHLNLQDALTSAIQEANSTVVDLKNAAFNWFNANGDNFVAYCFSPVEGYSAIGSYTGNGSTEGPFIYTGFRPRYILIKKTNAGEDWALRDTARSSYNASLTDLAANQSYADFTDAGNSLDILSNGFKLRTTRGMYNTNGGTYMYAAFAENPFKISRAR